MKCFDKLGLGSFGCRFHGGYVIGLLLTYYGAPLKDNGNLSL